MKQQYRIGTPLLLLFSTPFIVWQMGVLYFSGNTMSLFGRTPIPLTDSDITLVIVAGYIASIVMICAFPRKAVWMERFLLPVALISTVLMLFPLSAGAITVLFCVAAFVCVFSIGTMASIAAQQFTVETTWRDGILSMAVGGVLIAVLQNDFYNVSFTAFTVFSILLIAVHTAFYYLIPVKISTLYVSRENKVKMSKILFLGIWLINGFSTLLICFASAFAESVTGGVSIIYLSAAVMAVLMFVIRRKFESKSIRIFGCFFAMSVFGFVVAFLSLYLPMLQIFSCILLGFSVVLANLWVFFVASSFRLYPTRFIGAIGAAMGLVLATFHSVLHDSLRNNLPTLYGVYATLSVALLLIYFFLEPYFIQALSKETQSQDCPSAEPKTGKIADEIKSSEPHPFDVLSGQERVLAGLILDGYTETSIAEMMNISLNTQKGYRKSLYCKLDIHSKRELFEMSK